MVSKSDSTGYKLNWTTIKKDWPLWLIMAGCLVASVIVYPHLPPYVPGHWNIRGEVDAYYPRLFGAFFAPVLVIVLYLLMLFLPLVDPKKENYQRFAKAYAFLRWSVVMFGVVLYLVTIMAALKLPVNVGFVVKASVAVLFMIIGNFMGQLRHNYFVGIKTPWTLASEEVWQKTHRKAGKLWVAGGLLCLALSFAPNTWASWAFFAVIILMTVVPIIQSYLLFTRK